MTMKCNLLFEHIKRFTFCDLGIKGLKCVKHYFYGLKVRLLALKVAPICLRPMSCYTVNKYVYKILWKSWQTQLARDVARGEQYFVADCLRYMRF